MPDGETSRDSGARIKGIVALIALAAIAYLVIQWFTPSLSDSIRRGTAPRPPLTPENTVEALVQAGAFQVLISYTDRGFEPASLQMRQGTTVRFTNNSSRTMRVMLRGAETAERTLAPQEFWQHTFTMTGRTEYVDGLNSSRKGTVNVTQ